MTPERRKELLASVARKQTAAQIVWPPSVKDEADLRESIARDGWVSQFVITYEEARAMFDDRQLERYTK